MQDLWEREEEEEEKGEDGDEGSFYSRSWGEEFNAREHLNLSIPWGKGSRWVVTHLIQWNPVLLTVLHDESLGEWRLLVKQSIE